MSVRIASVARVEDPDALAGIVEEYLSCVLAEFQRVSWVAVPVSDLSDRTLGNLGAYLPPRGRLLLATEDDGRLVGVVFLKQLRPDTAEIKRLYVRPGARGQSIARRLMTQLLAEATDLGLRTLMLDTAQFLHASHRLYESLGFTDTERYPESENAGAFHPYLRYMQLDLSRRRYAPGAR